MKKCILFAVLLAVGCFFAACKGGLDNMSGPTLEETQPPSIGERENEIVVVFPESDTALKNVGKSLRDLLRDQAVYNKVSFTTDTSLELRTGTRYLVLGNTALPVTAHAREGLRANESAILFEDAYVALYAPDDVSLRLVLQNFLGNYVDANGRFVSYDEKKVIKMDVSKMILKNWEFPFPAYTAGILTFPFRDAETKELRVEPYSLGYGMDVNSSETTEMYVIEHTTVAEYHEYLNLLAEYGYRQTFSNCIDGCEFAQFRGNMGENIYVSYLSEGKVRVIHDVSSDSLEDFNYTYGGEGVSEFYMYRLNSVAEDTFLIRTPDNKWIFIDGAVADYKDIKADFTDEIFHFMKQHGGFAQDGKVHISCWYMSHPHRDHLLAFCSLIRKYKNEIVLERCLFNAPDQPAVVANDGNYPQFIDTMEAIRRSFPDVVNIKAHTGMKVQLADVTFEFLATQEDVVEQMYIKQSGKGITYGLDDINNYGCIAMISVSGMKVLELGDAFRADLLCQRYHMEVLECDILKVAHHYYNKDLGYYSEPEKYDFYQKLYDQKAPSYALVTRLFERGQSYWGLNSYLMQKLGKNAGYLEGSTNTVRGFRMENGKIIKTDYKVNRMPDYTADWDPNDYRPL